LKEIARICKERGKVAAIGGIPVKDCRRWAKEGYQLFSFGYVTNNNVAKVKPLVEEVKALIK